MNKLCHREVKFISESTELEEVSRLGFVVIIFILCYDFAKAWNVKVINP